MVVDRSDTVFSLVIPASYHTDVPIVLTIDSEPFFIYQSLQEKKSPVLCKRIFQTVHNGMIILILYEMHAMQFYFFFAV